MIASAAIAVTCLFSSCTKEQQEDLVGFPEVRPIIIGVEPLLRPAGRRSGSAGQGLHSTPSSHEEEQTCLPAGRFTEHQIVAILKQHDAGSKVADICRENGISVATFHNWKAKYGGMDASQLKQIKDLQEENSRLKRMFSELSMVHDALKQVVEKKWGA